MQLPYIVQEIMTFCFVAVIPVALTIPVISMFGLLWGIVALLVGLIISISLGLLMGKNEFTPVLRGKGIITVDLNSTGILRFFVVNVRPPYMEGQDNGRVIKDVFDRNAVFNLVAPKKVSSQPIQTSTFQSKVFSFFKQKKESAEPQDSGAFLDKETGDLYIKLQAEEYQKSRFGYRQFPCVIYNSHINSFVTKDFLSNQEKEAMAEHPILNQNKLLEELNRMLWHLCRSSIDLLNPNKGQIGKTIMWAIIIIGIVVLGVMFVPNMIQGFSGSVGGALGTPGQAVTPMP